MSDDLFKSKNQEYQEFLVDLKERIQRAKVRAALAVNSELILLYWQIGRDISQKFSQHKWGAKIIERLAADLKRAHPEWKGFSSRNLRYMRSFAEAWPDEQILQAWPAKITWYHNCTIFDKLIGLRSALNQFIQFSKK
ncbi:MAG: hypothetical protein HXX20_24910 [Chloroflexi bacterium]|nr:hypothetical protein [Chloroflexota bacterium]